MPPKSSKQSQDPITLKAKNAWLQISNVIEGKHPKVCFSMENASRIMRLLTEARANAQKSPNTTGEIIQDACNSIIKLASEDGMQVSQAHQTDLLAVIKKHLVPNTPMNKTAHLVIGQKGKYADQTKWIVAIYLDPKEAEQHRSAAQEEATQQGNSSGPRPLDPLNEGSPIEPSTYSVNAVVISQSFALTQKQAKTHQVLVEANQDQAAALMEKPSTGCSL